MKVKRNVEQALAEARSELSHGDYLTLCASLTFLNREIPEASVSGGDIFYMLGWLTQVSEGMGIDYTKHEAGKAVFHAEGKKHEFCITGMDIKTPEGRAAELCRIQREFNEYLCDFEVAFRCSKPGVFQNLKEKGEQMEKEEAQYHIISTLDDIAWILNVRGNDIPHVPVVLSFLVIGKEDAMWFVEENALSDAVKEMAAECGITIRPYEDVYAYAATIPENSTVLLDKRKVNYRITNALSETVHIVSKANPSQLMKSIKNEIELENTRKAHLLDGIAVTKFMYWLKKNVGKIPMDEVSVSDYLQSLREQMEGYRDISFDTIAGYNANAAMMHYKAEPDTAAKLEPQGMLLVDSGGHYDTGPTDITRTFVLGPISDIQKKHFTMVVKSNLNLANVKFLYGCNGISLDVICREPIWKENLDYQCGTGHGVGYLLNVHEGPNSFRWRIIQGDNAVLEEGMITSDEPGYYVENQYGIRHENLLVCKKAEKTSFGQFMCFEHLTMVPFDLDAVVPELMTVQERALLNNFHAQVYKKISPYLEEEEKEWLKEATREI